jgi:hypothetical protein
VGWLVYCIDRLFTSPAAGTEPWTNGTVVGFTGGLLAGIGWIWRTLRHRGVRPVPWQWFTAVLLIVSAVVPHAHNNGRGKPPPPITSFEGAAMTAYTIASLISMLVLVVTAMAVHRFRVRPVPEAPAPPARYSKRGRRDRSRRRASARRATRP